EAMRETTPDIGFLQGLSRKVMEAINEHAGDTPVHVLDDATFERAGKAVGMSKDAPAYYDPLPGHIVIKESHWRRSPNAARVMFHEAVHAATNQVINTNSAARKSIRLLMDRLKEQEPGLAEQYGYKNEHEFLAEAFTNPDFQFKLSKTRFDSGLR